MESLKNKYSVAIFYITTITISVFVIWLVIHFPNFTHKVFSHIKIATPYHDFLLGLIVYIFLTFMVLLFRNRLYFIFWNIKAFVTLVFMIIYEHIYGLDAYVYYAEAIKENIPYPFGENGTFNMMYIHHWFTYIVGNSYYSLKLLDSFFAFLTLILFYKLYQHIMCRLKIEIGKNDYFIYILFLLPSIIFWSSILGKDPLNLVFVGLFTYAFIMMIDQIKIRYVVLMVISIIGVSYIRLWYSIIFVMAVFFYYLRLTSIKQLMVAILLAPVGYIMLQSFLHKFGVDSIDTLFLNMSTVSKNLAYGNSKTEVFEIKSMGDYLLYFIPNFFTAVFRPLPFDAKNPFMALAAIENTIMLYLFYKYVIKNFILILSNKYMKFLMSYIFAWSLIYVILSPGNLGMAVRFKLQILPAILLLIFISRKIVLTKKKKRIIC